MSPDEIKQLILEMLQEGQLSSLVSPYHAHTTTDVGQLDASKCLINSPQAKLTAATGGGLSSGGAAVLSSSDSAILTNAITRLGQLESKLTIIGLIKSS